MKRKYLEGNLSGPRLLVATSSLQGPGVAAERGPAPTARWNRFTTTIIIVVSCIIIIIIMIIVIIISSSSSIYYYCGYDR